MVIVCKGRPRESHEDYDVSLRNMMEHFLVIACSSPWWHAYWCKANNGGLDTEEPVRRRRWHYSRGLLDVCGGNLTGQTGSALAVGVVTS